ncbi:MAG: ABC transporter ATP-binding protein [Thermoleophilia bacterium]
MTLLSVEDLDVRHGLLKAVRGVGFDLAEGEILALVGANGAGKTTLMRAIAGAHKPTGGRVVFEGKDVTSMSAHRRVRAGIALVPEGRRLFPDLTVEENLRVAGASGRTGQWTVGSVLEAFPLLKPLRAKRAATLSGGEQQATAIGRALMTNPRVLLLDEVSLGLAPVAVESVYRSLQSLIYYGATIILVEQDLARAKRVAGRIMCMLEGKVVLEGAADTLSTEEITKAYFGLGRARQHMGEAAT